VLTTALYFFLCLQRGFKVVALTRKPEKTQQLFNNHPNLEVSLIAGQALLLRGFVLDTLKCRVAVL